MFRNFYSVNTVTLETLYKHKEVVIMVINVIFAL